MANLLPIFERVHGEKRYRARLFVSYLTLFAVVVGLATVFLIPSYLIFQSKQHSVSELLAIAKEQPVSKQARSLEERVKHINKQVETLEAAAPTRVSQALINSLLDHKTDRISLTFIALQSNERITLRGKAVDRASLVAFVESLEADEQFDSVNSPIGNLIENTNISFSIILETTKQ